MVAAWTVTSRPALDLSTARGDQGHHVVLRGMGEKRQQNPCVDMARQRLGVRSFCCTPNCLQQVYQK